MAGKRCINCMGLIEGNTSLCPHCGYTQQENPSPIGLKPNTILRGHYQIGRILGQGGFGITYIGYDLTLDIRVAIKEYFPMGSAVRNCNVSNLVEWNTAMTDSEQWQRESENFIKEARKMAKIDSIPGIVRVRDTFPANQTTYIVMDYIEGETLKERLLKSGPMDFKECMKLFTPLMESLEKMHQKGMIHRDISPDNIMVNDEGIPYLLDFGAAKDLSFHQSMASRQVTKKGFSPIEQYQNAGTVGTWTDVYALCATIYYCLTGKVILNAPDRIKGDDLNVYTSLKGLIGESAAKALEDGLKMQPKDRIQTVAELLDKLTKDLKEGREKDKNRKTALFAGIGVAALCIAVFVSMQFFTGSEGPVKKVLMADSEGEWINDIFYGTVLGSDIKRDEIVSVTFLDTFKEAPDTAWDVSAGQDNTVRAWTEQDAGDTERYDLFISAKGGVKGGDCYRLFSGYYNLEEINFNGNFDTSNATNMKSMFEDCEKLETLEVSSFETEKVTDMSYMFNGCSSLSQVDVSGFDTGQVTDMGHMFSMCSNLSQANVSGFDTGKVTDVNHMFYKCGKLTELDVSKFNMGLVTDMSSMFYECKNLASLDVSNFDTSRLIDARWMFYGCESLTALDVSGFNTSAVTNMKSMFYGCKSLTALDVSGFNTGNVTDLSYMFYECNDLKELDVSGFDTKNVTEMGWMFYNCNTLTELNVGSFDTVNVTNMKSMFYGCANLAGLDVSSFNTGKVTDMSYMFSMCKNLKGLDVSNFDTAQVTEMSQMFEGCGLTAAQAGFLTNKNVLARDYTGKWNSDEGVFYGTVLGTALTRDSIETVTFLSTLDTMPDTAWDVSLDKNGTVMAWTVQKAGNGERYDLYIAANGKVLGKECDGLFAGYTNVKSIEFNDSFDTSTAVNMNGMFLGCENLTALDVSSFETGKVTDMAHMFRKCKMLLELDLNSFDTSNVTNMTAMFYKCDYLDGIDVSGFNTDNVTNMSYMFGYCSMLSSLDVSGFSTNNVTDMSWMFEYCNKLTQLDVSNFNTGNAENMDGMFYRCNKVEGLNVSGFNTGNVTSMRCMFEECESIAELDVSGFDTGKVTNMSHLFKQCTSLTKLDVSGFIVGAETDVTDMFADCAITAEAAGM